MPNIIPLLHPAAILRGRFKDEPIQITHLRRTVELFKRQPDHLPQDYTQPPPNTRLFPSLQDLHDFRAEACQIIEPALSFDTEEAGWALICVGFTWVDLHDGSVGKTLGVPIRLRGGLQYWNRTQLPEVIKWLDELLGNPDIAKVGHNIISHDIPVLRQLGFRVEGPLYDTMILAHLGFPEFKKSLQFCSTLHLGAGVWKTLVDEEDELEGKG